MNQIKAYCDTLLSGMKQTGQSAKEPDIISLRAGKLTMIFRDGALRYISAGGFELIRMIYAAVRDKNWITIKSSFSDEKFGITPDSFHLYYTAHYLSDEIDFTADYEISGTPDNSIVCTMQGIANRSFLKNRIGFCILHPVENTAGCAPIIEHSNGTSELILFPKDVSPHQIFRDVKSMNWTVKDIHCRLDLEGDVFETEDQRNWTDASFKTYSTPLSVPYPVLLEKGTRIFQKVRFKADGSFKTGQSHVDKIVIEINPDKPCSIPSVGICRPIDSSGLGKNEIKILRLVRFDHYRVDLHLYSENWKLNADLAYHESLDLSYPIEFALFIDDHAAEQILDFINWYSDRSPSVARIIILHKSLPSTPDQIAREVIPVLRQIHPEIRLATGTNANFAQLNRNRPGETGNDSVCYSMHPQEHASDNLTLVENLRGQEYSVRTAGKIFGKKGIIISPVTIQRRFNANNTMIELPWTGSDMPPQVDSRLMSLFGAGWTAGSLKYLSEAGADSITYHQTIGERGIIQGGTDSKWPLNFPSVKGMIFPVYYVFKYFLENKKLNLITSKSSKPLAVDCVSISDGQEARIIIVNFTDKIQPVQMRCCSGLFKIRTLCANNFGEAASDYRWTGKEGEKIIQSDETLKLEPNSINFLDGWLKH